MGDGTTSALLTPSMRRWLLIVVFVWQFCSNVEVDIFAAFVRTLIRCDTPTTSHFSGSAHCGDKAFVVQQAAKFTSIYGLTSNMIKVLLLPTIGALGDSLGRRPVLLAGLLFAVGGMFLFGVAAHSVSLGVTLTTSVFMALSTTPNPMSLAMMADVTTGEDERKTQMSAVFMMIAAGNMTGMLTSMGLTYNDVSDYTWVFVFLTGVSMTISAVGWLKLPETHAETARLKFKWQMANPATSFQLLRADPPLVFVFVAILMAWMAGFGALVVMNPIAVMLYGWSQMAALLPGFSYVVVNVAMLALQERMKDRIPLYPSLRASYIVYILGMLTLTLFAPFHPAAAFIAFGMLGGAVAFLMPAAATVVSLGLKKDEQAKGQALGTVAALSGVGLGVGLYTGVLYDSSATGMRAGIPFFLSSLLACGVALLFEGFLIARKRNPLTGTGEINPEGEDSTSEALLSPLGEPTGEELTPIV